MVGAFSEKFTPVVLQVPDERPTFHAITLKRLPNDFSTSRRLLDEFAIRLQHHLNRFLEIGASFFECRSLRIRPGNVV